MGSRSTQTFILSRSSKWVIGISGNLVVKNKLPPRSGSSLEAIEPHPLKGAIKFFNKTKNLPLKCINRVIGLLTNNPPAIQLHFKFEFILCTNWGTSYKDIKTQMLVVNSVVWSGFPGTVSNQKIHFVVRHVKIKF